MRRIRWDRVMFVLVSLILIGSIAYSAIRSQLDEDYRVRLHKGTEEEILFFWE